MSCGLLLCACGWNESLTALVWSCSVDHAPSDEGLCKVLQKHPNWETYAIPLGLTSEQVDYFYRMKRGDNGVLALRHWRDGHCGEDHPGTWRFLLKVIKDSIGPVPAGDLEKKVPTNCKWTQRSEVSRFGECTFHEQSQVGICPSPSIYQHPVCHSPSTNSLFAPPLLLTSCLLLPSTKILFAPPPRSTNILFATPPPLTACLPLPLPTSRLLLPVVFAECYSKLNHEQNPIIKPFESAKLTNQTELKK